LRTNPTIPESNTIVGDKNDSKVAIDLPVFSVVNHTATNSTDESINKV